MRPLPGRNLEQILLAYSLPKETVKAIMKLYKNMKAMVCLPDRDTNFLDILLRYINTIFVYTLPRLRILAINKFNEIK